MAVIYATFAQFTDVYSLKGVSETEINSQWLPHGALRVNERLSGYFTTPFTSTNFTARDLSISYAAIGIFERTRTSQVNGSILMSNTDQRITDIRCGNTPMIFDDGTALFVDDAKFDAWNSTQTFEPVFNMLDAEQQQVDPDLNQDTFNQR